MVVKVFKFVFYYLKGIIAARYATGRGGYGMEFDRYGRRMGWRLLNRKLRTAVLYLLNPVSIVRYFEFPFVLSCLPKQSGRFLDISSPRLFGLYVAENFPDSRILMTNPDGKDIAETRNMVSVLGVRNVQTEARQVNEVPDDRDGFDCIWSISVFEHIEGVYNDSDAIRKCFSLLRKGGRLIITIPVDRRFRNEYLDKGLYGTQAQTSEGKYFFQRYYDETAIKQRLLTPIGKEATVIRWFGEKIPGHYADYERRWIAHGVACTIDDPREIVDHYQEFESWSQMPGMGVCGLMIEKT